MTTLTRTTLTHTLVIAVLVGACTGSGGDNASTVPVTTVPVTTAPETFGPLFVMPYPDGMQQLLEGMTFQISESGCAYYVVPDSLRDQVNPGPVLLAFLPGTVLALEGDAVILPDGSRAVSGEVYDLTGGGMDSDLLMLSDVQPRWQAAVAACAHDGLIFDIDDHAFYVNEFEPPTP